MGLLRREVEKWVSFMLWFLLNCLIMSDDCGKKPERKKKNWLFCVSFHVTWWRRENSGSSWKNINFKKKLYCGREYFLMETLLLKNIACWSIFCFLSFILFIKLKSIWPLFVVWHGILWRRRRMRQTLPVASFVIVGDRLGVYQWLGFFGDGDGGLRQREENNEDFLLLDLSEKKMTHSSS